MALRTALILATSVAVSYGQQTAGSGEFIGDYSEEWKKGEYRKALGSLTLRIEHSNSPLLRWVRDRAALRFEVGDVDGAIDDMERVVSTAPEPAGLLNLTVYYQYRGRMDDYRRALNRASTQIRQRWRYGRYAENIVAIARIAELQGENPKTILTTILGELIERNPSYVLAYVAAGDLAYRKYDYQLASDYYAKALDLDEENQGALVGLAECYWKSSDERLDETIERIAAINPHHLRIKALKAELLLDTGKVEAALKIIEQGLEINPNHLGLLSLKSAAYFLDDDLERMRATQEQALAFNPHASEVFRTAGRIASRHYRFAEGAQFQQRALEVAPIGRLRAPADAKALGLHGFDLVRLGRQREGRSQLQLAFDADPYNVHVYNMLKVLDTLDEFALMERGPFTLQMPKDEAGIIAEDALALLREAHERYEAKYEIELSTPILVQIFDNHDDFIVRSIGLPGSVGYMGICFGQLITMDSPSARPKWQMNWRSVLWHEFVHVVTLQKTNNRMPRWLSEGISVYEETEYSPAWGQRMDLQYKGMIDNEPLPGLSDLEGYFTRAKTPGHLMFGYFLAGEFVRFYIEAHGFEALRESLALIGAGGKAEDSLAEAADKSIKFVDRGFKDYLETRLAAYQNLPSMKKPKKKFFDFLTKKPETTIGDESWGEKDSLFTTAMRNASEALEGERWDEAEAELNRAHEAFPDYMGADAPLRRLIKLYDKLGRREKLIEALGREIEWNQSDFPACRRLVELMVEDEDWPEVRRLADWALGIDPFDLPMREALLGAQLKIGDEEGALVALAQLAELDRPHAADHTLKRIDLLIDKKRWETAREETVALLEETPHFWEAQRRLLRIAEHEDQGGDDGVAR